MGVTTLISMGLEPALMGITPYLYICPELMSSFFQTDVLNQVNFLTLEVFSPPVFIPYRNFHLSYRKRKIDLLSVKDVKVSSRRLCFKQKKTLHRKRAAASHHAWDRNRLPSKRHGEYSAHAGDPDADICIAFTACLVSTAARSQVRSLKRHIAGDMCAR